MKTLKDLLEELSEGENQMSVGKDAMKKVNNKMKKMCPGKINHKKPQVHFDILINSLLSRITNISFG